jgi:hypothetical protein
MKEPTTQSIDTLSASTPASCKKLKTPAHAARAEAIREWDQKDEAMRPAYEKAAKLRRKLFGIFDSLEAEEAEPMKWLSDAICNRWIDEDLSPPLLQEINSSDADYAMACAVYGKRENVLTAPDTYGCEVLDHGEAYLRALEMLPRSLQTVASNATELFSVALLEWATYHSERIQAESESDPQHSKDEVDNSSYNHPVWNMDVSEVESDLIHFIRTGTWPRFLFDFPEARRDAERDGITRAQQMKDRRQWKKATTEMQDRLKAFLIK